MRYAAKAGNRAEIFKDVKALKGRYGANVRGNSFGAVDWQMRNLAGGLRKSLLQKLLCHRADSQRQTCVCCCAFSDWRAWRRHKTGEAIITFFAKVK